jgi:nitrate reductase assembly molybdenum cofactor insertion protein NarJ
MTTTHATDAHIADLLRAAARWRVLGRLFECPDPQWRDEIEALGREIEDDELREIVAALDETATPAQYYSMFGPGGPAPPREASYHESLELGSLMSELASYYEAFAYRPQGCETPDHVATEVGFVAYLAFKEAFAHAQGDEESADIAARAAARFISDHLSRLAAPLASLLADSPLGYLAHASRLLAARVGPPPTSGRLPMFTPPLDEDEGGELACGLP